MCGLSMMTIPSKKAKPPRTSNRDGGTEPGKGTPVNTVAQARGEADGISRAFWAQWWRYNGLWIQGITEWDRLSSSRMIMDLQNGLAACCAEWTGRYKDGCAIGAKGVLREILFE